MGAVEISPSHGGGLMRAPAFLDSEDRLPGTYPRNGKITNRYGGPGQKSQDYSASEPEGTLKHQIKIVHTRSGPL
jgi:hypothetical protein